MHSTELTLIIPVVLGLIIIIIFAAYFLSHLINNELEASQVFFWAITGNETPYEGVLKHDYDHRYVKRILFPYPERDPLNDSLTVASIHRFTKVRRFWLLFESIIYEGGVDYFDKEK